MNTNRKNPVMKKFASLLMVATIAACSNAPTPVAEAEEEVSRTVTEEAIDHGTPVTMADLSISGMTCAIGCGGTIKNTLAGLPGVEGTEIRFTDADQTNHAVVTYDPTKVSDADMVKAIRSIHDGQYKVLAVGITKQVLKEEGAIETPTTDGVESKVNAALEGVALPSLVDLLQRLIHI